MADCVDSDFSSIISHFLINSLDKANLSPYNIDCSLAEVAELVDAQASGACGSNVVRVQVPSSARDQSRAVTDSNCRLCFFLRYAVIAQLGERVLDVDEVAGSSPAGRR